MSPMQMRVDPEKVKAPKPAPGNQWYELRFKGFRPKLSAKKDSVNFNGEWEIINSTPENNGKKIYQTLNTKMDRHHVDFSHGLGFPLKPDASLEGDWQEDPKDPENVEKMQYHGPLLGKVAKAELVITSFNGNERNEIKQFLCKIDGCAQKYPDIKHLTNLVGKG